MSKAILECNGIAAGYVKGLNILQGVDLVVSEGEIVSKSNFDQVRKEDLNSIKIIEWPELVETNLANRLELHLKYSNKENERELSLVGHGKWKDINQNEL